MTGPRAARSCQLCDRSGATEQYKFIRPILGAAWPEVRVALRVCQNCKVGLVHGRFAGSIKNAEKIRKNLQQLTGRPWEWTVCLPHGSFVVREAPIDAAGRCADWLQVDDPRDNILRYGAPFDGAVK